MNKLGIEVLYPKADAIIAQTKEQASTYLILGKYSFSLSLAFNGKWKGGFFYTFL